MLTCSYPSGDLLLLLSLPLPLLHCTLLVSKV
jgi:hypothetical protein